jgi:integrase
MPVYPGRRPGTYRVVVYAHRRNNERTVRGTRRAALLFEAQLRLELGAHDEPADRAGLTLSQLCERYLSAQRTELRASTWRVRRSQLVAACAVLGPELPAHECTTARVEDYRARRAAMVRRSTVNNELRALGTALRWARSNGIRAAEPKAKRLRLDAPRVRAWSPAEVQRLLAAAHATSPVLLDMLVMLLNTGLRRGELLAAEWSWVDWRRKLLCLPCSDDWGPKSRAAREVPLSKPALVVLRRLRQPSGPVFRRALGTRYVDWPKDWWLPARTAAGLTGGVHQTRHTFASMFLRRRPDLPLLGRILGQSTLRVTERYTHMLPGHLAEGRNVVLVAPSRETLASTLAVDKMAHRKAYKTRRKPIKRP